VRVEGAARTATIEARTSAGVLTQRNALGLVLQA